MAFPALDNIPLEDLRERLLFIQDINVNFEHLLNYTNLDI